MQNMYTILSLWSAINSYNQSYYNLLFNFMQQQNIGCEETATNHNLIVQNQKHQFQNRQLGFKAKLYQGKNQQVIPKFKTKYAQNNYINYEQINKNQQIKSFQQKTKKSNSKIFQTQEEYQPQQSQISHQVLRKKCQTKNIIKNYSRAIFTFILKKNQFCLNVVNAQKIDKKKFFMEVQQKRQKVESIADFRQLLMEETNEFAKVYRIIFLNFLRRHSLWYTFNSKIRNRHRNIKYLPKLIQAVKNPARFTHIKDF